MLGSINNGGIVSWFKLYKFGKTDEILGKIFNQDLLFVNDLFDEDVKQKTDRTQQVILDRNLGFGVIYNVLGVFQLVRGAKSKSRVSHSVGILLLMASMCCFFLDFAQRKTEDL